MTREHELADRLAAIGEDLDDLAMERLTAAVSDGESRRPAADKTLTQARRAVEKAVRLLREGDQDLRQ